MFFFFKVIPVINMVIKEPRLQNGPLFYELASTLTSWEIKADISSEGTAFTFRRMLLTFWDGLSKTCLHNVDIRDADEKSLAAVSCLLQTLLNKIKPNKQKDVKIRFADEDDAESCTENEKFLDPRSSDMSGTQLNVQHLSPLRKEPLEELVCKLAELSIVYANEQKSDCHLKFLSALLSNFASSRVFQVLLEGRSQVRAAVKQYDNPSIQFLYEKLIDWLKEDWRKETDFLVDILYSVLQCCMSATERENILNDLTQVKVSCL